MPTFLLTLTMVLGMVGGVLAPGASPLARQVAPSLLQTAEITVGGVPLTVELAYQPADQALGLGYREGLAAGHRHALPLREVRRRVPSGCAACSSASTSSGSRTV